MLQREGYDVPVIMLTGYASIEHAVASIKAGAIDYITKPVRPQQLELAVDQALEYVRLRRENEALKREVMEIRSERQIIGDSSAVRKILQTVAMAAQLMATNGALARGPPWWSARATSSLPVPLSPVMRTGDEMALTRSKRS